MNEWKRNRIEPGEKNRKSAKEEREGITKTWIRIKWIESAVELCAQLQIVPNGDDDGMNGGDGHSGGNDDASGFVCNLLASFIFPFDFQTIELGPTNQAASSLEFSQRQHCI